MNKVENAKQLAIEKLKNNKYYIDQQEKPYYTHCFMVADILKESPSIQDMDFAVTVAYLHDIIEDTDITYQYIQENFGEKVADAVLALTKNNTLPKNRQLQDSLERIVAQSPEVASVKIADRLCNIRNINPKWSASKHFRYLIDSLQIYDSLKEKDEPFSDVLLQEIQKYFNFIGGIMDIKYFKLNGTLYAFESESGDTLKFRDGKWVASDKNIFHITRDENAVQLAQSEVSEIIKNNSVENSIDNANENANNLGE